MPSARTRAWCLTWNNPPTEWRAILTRLSEQQITRYTVAQAEAGTATQRPHIQAYLYFTNPRTRLGVKRLIGDDTIHLEAARGTPEQNTAYCTKEETRMEGETPLMLGTIPRQGNRSDIDAIVELIRGGVNDQQVLEANPRLFVQYHRSFDRIRSIYQTPRGFKPEVKVFWGPTGTGKTRRAVFEASSGGIFDKWQTCILLLPQTKSKTFFDGYRGHPNLILDEFTGQMSIELLLRLLDRYPLTVDTKGSTTEILAERIWITSNKNPLYWYDDSNSTPAQREALARRIDEEAVMEEVWSPPDPPDAQPIPSDED